jgi:hypothetical protein
MQNNYIIIILIIVITIIILYTIYCYYKIENIEENLKLGLCDINDDYILPQLYDNFITEDEAKYILENTNNKFKKSTIINNIEIDETIRKSETAWLDKNDDVIKNIITRVCNIGNFPFENAESMQVVKYNINGFYKPHFDTF